MDAGLPATRPSNVLTAVIAADCPMIVSKLYAFACVLRSARTSLRRRLVSSAFSTHSTTSSRSNGLFK